jgi:hypothetical protein
MTTSRIRKIAQTPAVFRALLAVALGLALSASGCIIDDSGGPGPGCFPDLTLSYVISDNATGTQISCATAGADTVRVTINGTPIDYPCNTGAGQQALTIQLDQPGTVDVFVELYGSSQLLSSVPTMTVQVGCGGYQIGTPAELPVNLPK